MQHTNPPLLGEHEILIIGAGASGIGAGVKLLEAGFSDFKILEKMPTLGGSWRDNTYPGCECDVPSALYSYSFAQKHDWSRAFAPQAEILGYLEEVAHQFGVLPHIEFNQPSRAAAWLEAESRWRITTDTGVFYAKALISCVGYLHDPSVPPIPGLQTFTGEWFHSSQWRHDLALDGKRIAVVGSGASAVQFIPKIQPSAQHLSVFQRTPQWVLPKLNHQNGLIAKSALGMRPFRRAVRGALFGSFELFGLGFSRPGYMRQIQKVALANLHAQVKDPELRAKLTPSYVMGCKRTLMSSQYYPALTQSNVTVHSAGLTKIEGNRLMGEDGSTCEADVLIFGTGFHVTDVSGTEQIIGASGRSLKDTWQGTPRAYKGTCIADFPNLFMVLGPNLGIGHNSAFVVVEAQLGFIVDALKQMRLKNLDRIEVKAKVQERFNDDVQEALKETVWNTGGCKSYYIDQNGVNSVGFPWSSLRMQKLLARWNENDFVTRSKASAASSFDISSSAQPARS